MDQRQTIEVVLPECKAVVTLYKYLRNGDFRLLQKEMANSVKFKVQIAEEGKEPEAKEIPGSLIFEDEDRALELLTKEIKLADGTPVTDIKDFYYNLTRTDGEFIYTKANELTKASSLTAETRKK
jgi:hypothetical protein